MGKQSATIARKVCDPRNDRWFTLFAVIVLGCLLLGAYSNTFSVPFIFDDRDSILTNPTLRSWRTAFFPPGESGITVSGRPILNFSFAINYWISGRNVIGYHITNLLIHFAAALSLFGLVRRVWRMAITDGNRALQANLGAFLVATVWAVHPLQTESVTYTVQRAESLVGLFCLLTLYCFVRSVQTTSKVPWLILSVSACFCGMGTKEVMAGVPMLVLLFDRAFVSGSFACALRQRRWFYTGLGASWVLLFMCIASSGARGGTIGSSEAVSSWQYACTQSEAIIGYVGLTFWPSPQIFDYGRHVVSGFSDVWWQSILILAALVTVIWLVVRNSKAAFLGACFFVLLAPSSSIFPVTSQTVAEHRFYLALAPVVIGVVWLLLRWGRPGLYPLAGAVLLLAGATHARNQVYHSELSVWSDTACKLPTNPRALFVCGYALSRSERFGEAEGYLQKVLRMDPDNYEVMAALGSVMEQTGRPGQAAHFFSGVRKYFGEKQPSCYGDYYYLGVAEMGLGEYGTAVANLRRAISCNEEIYETYYVLGNALLKSGKVSEAVDVLETALEKAPEEIMVRSNLGNALNTARRFAEAILVMEPGLEANSASSELRINLGVAYQNSGRIADAKKMFAEAARLRPERREPYRNLAVISLTEGDRAKACEYFEKAMANGENEPLYYLAYGRSLGEIGRREEGIDWIAKAAQLMPTDVQAQYFLAVALKDLGRWNDACRQYEQVLVLSPDLPEAHNGLGVVLRALGALDAARSHFKMALRLRSDYIDARNNLEQLERN